MKSGHEEILERVCKEVIEIIFMCLDHAKKGTVYLIGPPPELRAVRITSGERVPGTDEIRWGLPEKSDYNYPGKTWLQYRDEPGKPLEAMGWCVERQKSWTADNPFEDARSVKKQLLGEPEDFHHMEPVLLKKSEIYGRKLSIEDYPTTWDGKPIWQDTEYAVVAVIKIHFLPNTLKRGDKSTKLIKKLSKRLGSDLLSLHLRDYFYEARRKLDQMRIESCNILAHDLRNPIMKLGFVSSAINTEIAFLREQWENYILKNVPALPSKDELISELNNLLESFKSYLLYDISFSMVEHLLELQKEMKDTYSLPHKKIDRMENQVIPLWRELLDNLEAKGVIDSSTREHVFEKLDLIKRSFTYGIDEEIIKKVNHIPDRLKRKWIKVAYSEFTPDRIDILNEILELVRDLPTEIPYGHHISKNIFYLKTILEVTHELERRVSMIINALKNTGHSHCWFADVETKECSQ